MNNKKGIVRLFERKKKICYLFVDNDNLFNMLKLADWRINLTNFVDYLLSVTNCHKIRAFFYVSKKKCESPQKKNYLKAIKELGAEIINIPLMPKYRDGILKTVCNADQAITTDMMFHYRCFDTIVLASGDGDFEYPLKTLVREGKKVYIVSNMNSISNSFLNNSEFKIINLEEIKPKVELVYN
ncbi:NYN domain-containing protein [bacterium]|nr:NYN domain-containing protein [bacterium]